MPKTRLVCLTGYPGSGKSTLANELVRGNSNTVRINRDDLRSMLFCGRKWNRVSEEIVEYFEQSMVSTLLGKGESVVVDNTHLNLRTVEGLYKLAAANGAVFEHIDLTKTVSLATCIERDAERTGTARVGRGVIDRMALSNKRLDFSELDKVAVVDIDGTLGNLNWRLPFLEETPKNYDAFFAHVEQDGTYESIWRAVHGLRLSGFTIVVMSGRPTSTGHATNEWLNGREYQTEGQIKDLTADLPEVYDMGFNPDYLFMRQAGDHRPDDQVKGQLMKWMFECGLKESAIKIVLDDREQVCAVWRKLGLPLVKVEEGSVIEIAQGTLPLVVDLKIPIKY